MKVQFRALTEYKRPGIHLWYPKDGLSASSMHPVAGPDANGWWLFEADISQNVSIGFKLFEWDRALNKPEKWESEDETFNRMIMLKPGESLPENVWLLHDSNRILREDPTVKSIRVVRIHMFTQKECHIHVWIPGKGNFQQKSTEQDGHAYFELKVENEWSNSFNFVFYHEKEDKRKFEPQYFNRTWSSADGDVIWTHSEGTTILQSEPGHKKLVVHFQHLWGNVPVKMHLWQKYSNIWVEDFVGQTGDDGWLTYQTPPNTLYTGIPYRFTFFVPGEGAHWQKEEHSEAHREVVLQQDEERWTLEGSSFLFSTKPERNREVVVELVEKAPECSFETPNALQVKVDQALVNLPPAVEKRPDGSWLFWTYSEIVTSFQFSVDGQAEPVFHRIKPLQDGLKAYVVLGRPHCLFQRPTTPLFADPPYPITRPGMVEEEGFLRFAIHAPYSRVRLEGQWQHSGPVDLQCKTDGSYWWVQIPVNEVISGLPDEFNQDYHGARYRFILNDDTGGQANTDLNSAKTVHDPAAAWVETTYLRGYSKLVNHRRYHWQTEGWKSPSWDYLIVYELHPARLTKRNSKTPFGEIAEEIAKGYLHQMGITAILLMPSDEFPGFIGWGYNPSYYYAAKDAYGGPDELKKLVDACHQNGIAVLLDVVFNHTGANTDNVLFDLDRNTYIDGKTEWSYMPNYDNQICRDFFAQCLVQWNREYHIDGFRFDMTNPIVEGDDQNPKAPHVVDPNHGDGGWGFLHYLREKLKAHEPNCLMMAEQFPNNWGLTNYGGPMDTQWCDDFHDRLVEVCRGGNKLSQFADALKYSHTQCQQWYNVTNYSESHDEVGNLPDRIANVPGCCGRGLRINKVAAAATLLSRGIPMLFMGQEAGESRQFSKDTPDPLPLDIYETDVNRKRVRLWWKTIFDLRRHNPRVQGPAPIDVHYVDGLVIAFSRGEAKDYFIVLNFGDGEITQNLGVMNLPGGTYQERWNSTYPAFQVEWENEFRNWGDMSRENWLNIPDNGAVILERSH
jgi:1,4-alpha-glucan branching enzyme